jgi:cytochrome c-type protein NapB
MNKLLVFTGLLGFVFAMSCSGDGGSEQTAEKKNVNNVVSLGLITASVTSDADVLGAMPQYNNEAPGQAQTIERSFENAPPLIPHSTEGLVPIKKDANICLTCHMPDVAEAMKSTPIPASHMTDYRPAVKPDDGKIDIAESSKVVEKDLNGKLNMARYNCTQCHVPQAKVDVAVQNTFKSVFRNAALEKSSNLSENIDEGVK